MPLPKPALDNRSFEQLVAEGRGRIPRLAPQWTDHNASDPGITLLELAAWLTEQNIYRFERPSDEARRAFARLAGIRPRPPGVARTVVAVSDANGAGIALPARMQLAVGATEKFETTEPLYVSPAALTTPASGPAFGARPRRGSALYLGFDRPLDAPGQALSLHVWTEAWQDDAATRDALLAEFDSTHFDWRLHYRVRTVWEFHAGGGVWAPLAGVVDETRALSLSGFVRFTAPVGHQSGAGPGAGFYIRCRIAAGRFECPPRLALVAFNAVGAEHALSRPEKRIGLARGHAGASFAFAERPIALVAGRTRLRLDNGIDPPQTGWREVLDWDGSGAHDRDFRVTPERGDLQSGDGLRGAVLPAGYSLYVTYQEGGGEAGNLAAGALDRVPPNAANTALVPALAALAQPITVAQPFAASGGTPRETLRSVQARAHENASRVDKAVTVADFELLARATPGVPVAGVRAVPGLHPALPCYPAPGAVTLIVVPHCPLPAPRPSRALLDAVVRYLQLRRLVTCEIHAVAPVYRRITVHATLHLGCDTDAGEVRRRAIAAIDRFFDPLTGGPDGSGWPVGRTVYRSEVLALLANLDGVTRVTDFGLQGRGDRGPRCGNVELCKHELVVPGRHRLKAAAMHAAELKRSEAHECQP
jgi:baseplate J-like protein